jgi:hypothetical protein
MADETPEVTIEVVSEKVIIIFDLSISAPDDGCYRFKFDAYRNGKKIAPRLQNVSEDLRSKVLAYALGYIINNFGGGSENWKVTHTTGLVVVKYQRE